jgi:hypothetical protein
MVFLYSSCDFLVTICNGLQFVGNGEPPPRGGARRQPSGGRIRLLYVSPVARLLINLLPWLLRAGGGERAVDAKRLGARPERQGLAGPHRHAPRCLGRCLPCPPPLGTRLLAVMTTAGELIRTPRRSRAYCQEAGRGGRRRVCHRSGQCFVPPLCLSERQRWCGR